MKWTSAQDRAIEYMAQGMKISVTAKTIRVNRKTIHEWLNLPGFKQEVRTRTTNNLLELGKKVIHVLNKNMPYIEGVFDDRRASITERLRAFNMLLSNVRSLSELGDLNERITALEEQVGSG